MVLLAVSWFAWRQAGIRCWPIEGLPPGAPPIEHSVEQQVRLLAMKPYLQGALDGLCAIYSIVNATRIVAGIGNEEARELFNRIILYLEKTRDLSNVLINGIGLQTIGGILREVVGDRIQHRSMPFKQHPETPLDEFWLEMIRFLEGGSRRAVLIGIGGPHWDHWSIVHAISEKQIHFFDSHKLKRLNRNRCTTTRSTSTRPHVLCPTHTYFLH
jgi:hypothetical protein